MMKWWVKEIHYAKIVEKLYWGCDAMLTEKRAVCDRTVRFLYYVVLIKLYMMKNERKEK